MHKFASVFKCLGEWWKSQLLLQSNMSRLKLSRCMLCSLETQARLLCWGAFSLVCCEQAVCHLKGSGALLESVCSVYGQELQLAHIVMPPVHDSMIGEAVQAHEDPEYTH